MWDDVKEARWNDRQIISICSHVILNGTKWSEESQRFFASLRMTVAACLRTATLLMSRHSSVSPQRVDATGFGLLSKQIHNVA